MGRLGLGFVIGIALVAVMATSAGADPTASILEPISPVDYDANTGVRPVVATDSSGTVIIIFEGKCKDNTDPNYNKWRMYSLVNTGGGWQTTILPPGDIITSKLDDLVPVAIVPGSSAGEFHLLLDESDDLYYMPYQGGSWTGPTLVTGCGILAGVAVQSDGQPIISQIEQGEFHCFIQQGGWQSESFGESGRHYPDATPIYVDDSGIVHLLCEDEELGVVASLTAGASPLQASNWTLTPDGEQENWTSAAPQGGCSYVLDWPNQLIYASWLDDNTIHIAHAAIGSTSQSDWLTYQVPGEEASSVERVIVSNGRGAVGLFYYWRIDSQRKLYFRWLDSSGPSESAEIGRPPSETEAAEFNNMGTESLNFCIDDQGTAHCVVVAKKSGEETGNIRRVYYSTVTGGPAATTGETTTDDTQTTTPEPAPLPDFTVRIIEPVEGARYTIKDMLRGVPIKPQLEIENLGGQYFGRVESDVYYPHDADLDFNVVDLSDSIHFQGLIYNPHGHDQALFNTGQTRTYYTPRIKHSPNFDPDFDTVEDNQSIAPLCYGGTPAGGGCKSQSQTLTSWTGLGWKTFDARVDTYNIVNESNEDNNYVFNRFVVADGRALEDRATINGEVIKGLNDLAVLGQPILRPNTPLWRAGYLQQPTTLELVADNPRFASFFRNVRVGVQLDGQHWMYNTYIDKLDGQKTLFSDHLTRFGVRASPGRRADVAGAVVEMPISMQYDLTAPGTWLSVGDHQLRVVVAPFDQFGDLVPGNNEYTINFKLREAGGTLQVKVVDKSNPTVGIPDVPVVLREWYYARTDDNGELVIPDVPADTYNSQDNEAERELRTTRYIRRRDDLDIYYIAQAADEFTVNQNETTNVTIEVEKPAKVIGQAYNSPNQTTAALITDEVVHVGIKERYSPNIGISPEFILADVLPQEQTITAWAYSYLPLEQTIDVTPDENDRYYVNVTLQPGPRATISGHITTTQNNQLKPLKDVNVWLSGAPRATETDNDGYYELTNVDANRNCQVMAMKKNYTLVAIPVVNLDDGETRIVDLQLQKISPYTREFSFDCTARVEVEASEAYGPAAAWKVTVRHGMFRISLGLLGRRVGTEHNREIDQVVVGIQQGPAYFSTVATTWSPGKIISKGVEEAYGKVASAGFNLFTGLLEKADPIGLVQDYVKGNVDPNELHDGGCVGTYVSVTGEEYSSIYDTKPSLLDLAQGNIPLAGHAAGGWTRVRVDKLVLSDGETEKVISKQWFSPKVGIYPIGSSFDPDKLEVKLYVEVQNQCGTPFWGCARNVITWKSKNNHVSMIAQPYSVLPE